MGNLVVKDNALIEASHRLSEVEQRLVLLAILKARKHCNSVRELQGKELIIYADDYMQTFGVTRQVAYRMLKQAVMGLYRAEWGYKYINNKGNKVVAYERFTQSAKYIEAEATVKFMFANAIIPFLVELEKRFTTYEIEQVAQLSSQYAMRLYEFFMQNLDKKSGKGWLDISLDELRFRFGLLPAEYNRMGDFKKGVLDLAMSQINEKTDLSATYTQRKQGRTIVGFKFEFKQKANAKSKKIKDNTERDPNTKDIFDNLTDQEREIIAQKKTYANQKGITDPLHIQNLINQGLEQHHQSVQNEQERLKQQKEKRQAKKQKAQEQIAFAKQQYERILASDELIQAYIAHNINSKHLQGIRKFYYEQGDYHNLFKLEQDKFIEPHRFVYVNLDFMV